MARGWKAPQRARRNCNADGTSKGEAPSSSGGAKPHHARRRSRRSKVKKAKKAKRTKNLPTGKGVPAATITFSLSLPGPAPIGVAFFIVASDPPPFLIPSTGRRHQVQVPWQVLAELTESRDRLRPQPVGVIGRRRRLDAVPSLHVEGMEDDASGDGVADPYNPVDAIFTAARYLHAAGASSNLSRAILAYNHAGWYVESVLLRARLIGGIPSQLVGALTGLVEAADPAQAKYGLVGDQAGQAQDQGHQRRHRDQLQPQRQGHVDLRQEGLAGDRGQRRQDRRRRHLAATGPLREAPGRDRQHLHLRASGDRLQSYPVRQAGQVLLQADHQGVLDPASKAPTSAASAGRGVHPRRRPP